MRAQANNWRTDAIVHAHEIARKKVMAARTALILDQPFFGVLALRLKLKADPSAKTAWVDGRTMGYNPSFVEKLTHAQLTGLIAHEVMHVACGHPWRRDARDKKKWNVACDHAINPILLSTGFKLPEGGLFDKANEGKSAEWIYARLPQPQEPKQDEPEQGEQPGEVRDAPDDATEDGTTEGDWKAAVQQAANAAKAQGKLSGDLERFASDSAKSRVDWRSALRRFVQQTAAADYTWTRPSPRYMARGLYLPALHSEQMGPMVIAIDTSGSVDDVMLALFEAELRAIIDETNPQRVTVMYCDSTVKRIDTYETGDEIELNAVGGGGTKFGPVFDAIEEMDEQPACIIYLTDLEPWGDNGWPTNEPDVPTLWAATQDHEVPFGEVLLVNE